MAAIALAPLLISAFSVTGTGAIAATTVAAGLVGAYLDSKFILPKLMKGPEEDQAKGIGITGLDEGDPHIFSIGMGCRIPGFLYWQPRQPRFFKGEEGGKGGGSSKAGTQDRYMSDAVLPLTRTGVDFETNERHFIKVTEPQIVWFDGKIRYLGGRQTSSSSDNYEMYESVENVGGNVALIYTIQTKTPDPAGQSLLDWGLVNKFRAGERINISPCGDAAGGLPSLLQDGPEGDRPLYAVGSGVLPDGNHYLQVEWEYWTDPSIYQQVLGILTGLYSGYINDTFYGAAYAGYDPPAYSYQYSGTGFNSPPPVTKYRVNGGRVPFDAFLEGYTADDGRWAPPMLTDIGSGNGAVQSRGYMEYLGGGAGTFVEIKQQDPAVNSGLVTSITLRTGERNEPPIDIIEDYEGQGSQPALRGFSSLEVYNLNLRDFGNRIPNIETLVSADVDLLPIGEAIRRICTVYCGVPSDQIDTSSLDNSDIVVRGYWWKTPYSLAILQPLIVAYDLTVVEYEGKLSFRERTAAPVYQVPVGDLDCAKDGKGSPLVTVNETGDVEAVLSTSLKYTDVDSGYATGEQLFTRPDITRGRETRVNFTNLTLSAAEARAICQRITWQSSMYRRRVKITLGPKWGYLRAGDVLKIDDLLGTDWRLVIVELDRGADGRIEITANTDDKVADLAPDLEVEGGGSSASNAELFYSPPIMAIEAMDIGPLVADDYLTPALYLASCAKYYGADFRSSQYFYSRGAPTFLFNSTSGRHLTRPTTRSAELSLAQETPGGVLLSALGSGVPDVLNTNEEGFLVRLYEGELESVTIDRMLERESLLYMGGEVVAFTGAEIVEDTTFGYENTYRVYGTFLRGLYNTESKIKEHGAGTGFFLIQRSKLQRFPIEPQYIDRVQFRFQAVPLGGDSGDYDGELNLSEVNAGNASDNTGANHRPFPVAHIRAFTEPSTFNTRPWMNYTLFVVDEEIYTYDEDSNQIAWRCIRQHNPALIGYSTYPSGTLPPPNTTPSGPEDYWVALQSPRDYRIKWNYRSPLPLPTLPSSSAETRRGAIKFRLRILDVASGDVLRTVNDLEANSYQYTHEQMTEDGTSTGEFLCEVRAENFHMTSPLITTTLPGYD